MECANCKKTYPVGMLNNLFGTACDAEEIENIYEWVWVKPTVLILLFFGVLTGTTMFLIRRKGIQTISKNQRKFWRKKKREKRTQQDDVFHGHQ